MSLKENSFMMQITKAPDLKDLQQRVSSARERQQQRSVQLDKFQEIGAQLPMRVGSIVEAAQVNKKNIAAKMVGHPANHDLKEI